MMPHRIEQSFRVPFQYTCYFTSKVFGSDNDLLANVLNGISSAGISKCLVVIDAGVASAHPTLEQDIEHYFACHRTRLQLKGSPLVMEGGEACKNSIEPLLRVLQEVDQRAICRHSFIIGVGGGAFLDMLGLAASLSHRGVRHVRIPTTVLSQNDSGVGVKNGINLFGKKNFMGSFQPPVAVINDSGFLTTLHERDWRAGISEAIKVALIKDQHFFAFLEDKALALRERDMEAMKHLIHRCAEMHMEHIAKGDPFESGSSRPLDFGHWAAHKLEQLTQHELRHGEAVAIGIALDCTYAWLTGMLPETDWKRIVRLIQQLGLPLYHQALSMPASDNPEVINGLEEFREHLGGQLTIMLLNAIGTGTEVHHIDHPNIKKAIQHLADLHHTSLTQHQNQTQHHS